MSPWSIVLLILSAAAEEECALLQSRADLIRKDVSKPWDHHLYLVGTRHKAGSHLLRNIMRHAFDELGAISSCQEHPGNCREHCRDNVVTTKGGHQKCDLKPHIPIHWDNFLNDTCLERNRRIGAQISKPFRGVQIIRDPLQMVASAYCYHHRGHEAGSPFAPQNVTKMGHEEGVPAVAGTMLPVVKTMVDAYLASGTDVHTVMFENLTRSSQDFDSTVAQLFDALFGGLITDIEMARIREVVKQEDLHQGKVGLSGGYDHVSDDEDKRLAIAALDSIEPDLLEQYHEFQRVLGYTVGH